MLPRSTPRALMPALRAVRSPASGAAPRSNVAGAAQRIAPLERQSGYWPVAPAGHFSRPQRTAATSGANQIRTCT
jgi:hypothetical protein